VTDKNEEPKPIARLVAMLFKTVLHQQLELAALRQLREAKGVITLDELAEAVAREEADLSSLVELEALVDEDVRVLVEELKRRGRSERRHPRPEVRRPEHRRRGEVRHAAGRALRRPTPRARAGRSPTSTCTAMTASRGRSS
jgi:hypothetical protein